MRSSILRVVGGLAAGLVPVVAGCSGGDAGASSEDRDAVPRTEPAEPTSGSGEEASDPVDGADEPASSGSLGHVAGELPNWTVTSMVPLGLDVDALGRNGELVELEMTLTVEVEDPPPDFRFNLWSYLADTADTGGEGFDISGVRLIDQAGRNAYLPVVDSEGVCACSGSGPDIAPGDSLALVATFGGLPADVEQVDVLVPGFPPVEQLAIEG